ncbi:MAG: isoprenylcysteine carboxylmethyltransferase family protein [Oligoflexales bacterium]
METTPGVKIGETLFKLRDYTPIPLIILVLFVAKPNIVTATLGTLLIVWGELFRIYSVSFIGSISRTRKDQTGSKLVTEGPFSWMRNPLYVGNFFICIGFAVFSANIFVMVLTALLFGFQYYYIVMYEENLLTQVFNGEYAEYKTRVPAWFPRRFPKVEEITIPTDLGKALKSERRTLLTIVSLLGLILATA